MTALFDLLAVPMGYILWAIYSLINNYFVAIFIFTLVVRAATFPLSLKSQKSQADRAKLAPRLERIQKKYGQDRQKLAQKQQELYEKEGVSMTGGCLPMIVQLVVLMGIISVIYMPLKHLAHVPDAVVNAAVDAMQNPLDENNKEVTVEGKLPRSTFTGYYKELRMMSHLETYEAEVKENIEKVAPGQSQKYYDTIRNLRGEFSFFGDSLLENPWRNGFAGINVLWLIPLLSGLTALASSFVSMHYTKAMSGGDQPGQGCSNTMMLVMMPLFSLFITFSVPGGVGIYWICSNLIAVVQTVILNHIYNPAKIRAQAEIEYQERRRKKAEDKKRLAEARRKEEEDRVHQEQEERRAAEQARLDAAAGKKKPATPTKNPNKLKKKKTDDEEQKPSDEVSPETAVEVSEETNGGNENN